MKNFIEERVNKPILKNIKQMTEEISVLQRKIKEAKSTLRVRCSSCEKLANIGNLTYIQTLYYVPPEGCTGGAYYEDGEGRFRCKHCGRINRLIHDRKNISELRYHFEEIVQEED